MVEKLLTNPSLTWSRQKLLKQEFKFIIINFFQQFFISGLILLWVLLTKHNSPLAMVFCFVALSCVFLYRQMKHNSFPVLVLFWTSLLFTQIRHCKHIFYNRKDYGYETKGKLVEFLATNLTCSFLISALLHRPHNVILLPVLLFTLETSYHLGDNLHIKNKKIYGRCYVLVLKTVITIFIANMFYFFQVSSFIVTLKITTNLNNTLPFL